MATSVLTDNSGTTGEINVTWTDAEKPADFYAWRLYQRRTTAAVWTKIYETLVDSASYDVDTYGWANAVAQEIILIGVSQNTTTGVLAETAYTGANSFTPTGDTKYTLVHPTTPALSVILGSTVKDSYSEEDEHEVINLLDLNGEGGGRKVNLGSNFGKAGTLSAQLRDSSVYGTAASQLLALEDLHRAGTTVFLRDPFGGLTRVYVGTISIDRIPGVGTSELVDVSFSYSEVI